MAFIVADVVPLLWMKPHCYDWCYCHINVLDHFMNVLTISDITIANVNGWCYCHCGWCFATIAFCYIVVDVTTTCCWLMLLPNVWWLMLLPNMWWLMLLPSVVDGIATLCEGWCYYPVADGITTWLECRQTLLPWWQMKQPLSQLF